MTSLRPRVRAITSVVSLTTTLVLVATSLLALHHAAEVAHVRDPRSGELVHASSVAGHERGSTSQHAHQGSGADADTAACALLAVTAGTPATRPIITVEPAPAATTPERIAATDAPGPRTDYRLAPKTSPPARA